MKSKLKMAAMGIFLVALLVFQWHCISWLLSTTLRITFYVEEGIYAVEEHVEMAEVDLLENEDWEDHHDDVKGIQRILFASWVINRGEADAIARFYVSRDCSLTTAAQVRSGATLVLDGITVPAHDSTYITASDSYRYLRNQDVLKDLMMEGMFCLYCIAEDAPFELEVPESVAVVIDFTYVAD